MGKQARRPVFWTPERVSQLRTLRFEGKSDQACADVLGTTLGAVKGAINYHGLPRHWHPKNKGGVPRQEYYRASRVALAELNKPKLSLPPHLAHLARKGPIE